MGSFVFSKKLFIFPIYFTMILAMVSSVAMSQTAVVPDGDGTDESPYLISELGNLVWMSDNVASSAGKYYKMTADIDASETATWNDSNTDTSILEGFTPIGKGSSSGTTCFCGIFDGDGHTITGLAINRSTSSYIGLFGTIGSGGVVRNVGLLDCTVIGMANIGGLVGFNAGTVSNGYTTGNITGAATKNYITFLNTGVGGLVGYNTGTISNVHSLVKVTGRFITGGLVGINCGTVYTTYASGIVTGIGSYSFTGGLIGRNIGTVSMCYATGSVTGVLYVGGLIGANTGGTVLNTYATGSVSGTSSVGGLLGNLSSGTVSYSYATGLVTGTSSVGGLIGTSTGSVTGSYWDIQTTGQSTSAGTGKTTDLMKQQATFTSWDFASVWGISESTSYPYLQFSPPPFKLTVMVAGSGRIAFSPEPENGGFTAGTRVTLTAIPNSDGYILNKWGCSVSGNATSVTVLMDGHKDVTAEFMSCIRIDSINTLQKIGKDASYPLENIYYLLTADINASETATWNDTTTDTTTLEGFMPIGTYSSSSTDTTSFRGIFDGGGHKITGLVIKRSSKDYVGLFGAIGSAGIVRNLILVDESVSGNNYTGGLAGYNSGAVSNSGGMGAVTGRNYIGGLIGQNNGSIYDDSSNSIVTGASYVGGLIGYQLSTTVSNSYSSGAIKGGQYVGGLIGKVSSGMVSCVYATGSITGYSNVGGLVGYNSGTLLNTFATGTVIGSSTVGGLIGYCDSGTVSNSYAVGAVPGNATGQGLVGFSSDSTISGSYWNTETTGCSTSHAGTSKTTIQMKQQSTFSGWDFTSIWGISEGTSYPYLRFSNLPFTLDVTISGKGHVNISPEPVDGGYMPGTVVTMTAEPETTYALGRWKGATSAGNLSATILMDSPKEVTAEFLPVIEIDSIDTLQKIGNDANYPLSDVYYRLTSDIDASSTVAWTDKGTDISVMEGFKPIGTYSSTAPDTTSFRAIFDGGGHIISGLVINRSSSDYVGLFGCIGLDGEIREIGLIGGNIFGKSCVGALVGKNYSGTVTKAFASSFVKGSDAGGLIGWNYGTAKYVYASGQVLGTPGAYAGGLIGINDYGITSNAYASDVVTMTNNSFTNYGLTESNTSGSITNSFWDTDASGQTNSDGGTGKTTHEMKQQATFPIWDFSSIWSITEGLSYPYLQSLPPPFKLNVTVIGSGQVTVSPEPTDGSYEPGTVVTLTALDTSGYTFYKWNGTAQGNSSSVTLLMDGHKGVVATFLPVITIDSIAALQKIGNDANYPLSKVCYRLTSDIDASETAKWNDSGTDASTLEGFNPIGNNENQFMGIFDGGGHKIRGLVINRPSSLYIGLFGFMGIDGEIRNLGLEGGAITGKTYVGALVGNNYCGKISTCYSSCAVTGMFDYIGGLIGYSYYGTVSNSYATGCVTASGLDQGTFIGGLIGNVNAGTIENTYSCGRVTGLNSSGGLTGSVYDITVSGSYWDVESSLRLNSSAGTGKTTSEMKQQATFSNWNFTNTWSIVEGQSYPYLQFASPPFKLDIQCLGSGKVFVSPESVDGMYPAGTIVTLTAIPASENYALARWKNVTSSDGLTSTVTMDSSKMIVAEFLPVIKIDSITTLQKIGHDSAYPLDGVYYSLTTDINASETAEWNDDGTSTDVLEGFNPIGTDSTISNTISSFRGIFEGNNHTITGLVINRISSYYVGLFGCVGSTGEVRNTYLIDSVISGKIYVGGLVGLNYGTLLSDATNGSITAFNISSSYAGGLVGKNYFGTVKYTKSKGTVTGFSYIGGLVGLNQFGTVTESSVVCKVTGNFDVGGFIGSNSGFVSMVSSSGEVIGSSSVGGLIGFNDSGEVINTYSTSHVSGNSTYGGLIGDNSGKVYHSYAAGILTQTGYYTAEGLIGNGNGSVVGSYWDTENSGCTLSYGGTSKTTAQMKQQATFVDWEFDKVWIINECVTYPLLRSLLVAGDANVDGVVDVGDLGVLAANYGVATDATWFKGDFNGDGVVDVGDLGILAANYGSGVSGSVDYDADYEKIFGSTAEKEAGSTDVAVDSGEEDTGGSICSGLGLIFMTSLIFAGLFLVELEKKG